MRNVDRLGCLVALLRFNGRKKKWSCAHTSFISFSARSLGWRCLPGKAYRWTLSFFRAIFGVEWRF